MTDEEYAKYFLVDEYYDILTTEEALVELWQNVIQELDAALADVVIAAV